MGLHGERKKMEMRSLLYTLTVFNSTLIYSVTFFNFILVKRQHRIVWLEN